MTYVSTESGEVDFFGILFGMFCRNALQLGVSRHPQISTLADNDNTPEIR